MIQSRSGLVALVVMLTAAPAVFANVVTDWDEIAVKTIQPPGPVPPVQVDLTFRAAALVNVAMFNAVDCIEPKYRPVRDADGTIARHIARCGGCLGGCQCADADRPEQQRQGNAHRISGQRFLMVRPRIAASSLARRLPPGS